MKRRYRALLCAALIVALAGAGAAWVRARQDTPGPILYTVPLSGSPAALVVDGRTERVFVTAARDGAGSMLDARTGALVGVMLIPGAALAVDERAGTFFAVGPTVVSMLDATNGRFLRQLAVGETPTTVAVDARVGHAFVVDPGNNAVYMLDTRTGAVLRTIPAGVDPVAIAVDEESGRVFVATRGGAMVAPDRWRWLPSWLRDKLPFLPPPGPHLRVTPPGVTAFAAPSYGN